MRVTVFTSNQPRHLAFVRKLQHIADVTAIIETMPFAAGANYHASYKSDVMKRYFERVLGAEFKVFGAPYPLKGVEVMPLAMGDASYLEAAYDAATYIVVFGASYIREPCIDWLIKKRAVNIHMGISPEYRGSSCNFWAMYDNRPDLVGASVHLLTKGLDSGPILFHARPQRHDDPFEFTMRAVEAAQDAVCERIVHKTLFDNEPFAQDRAKELKYTRASDFTDEIAAEYLARVDNG